MRCSKARWASPWVNNHGFDDTALVIEWHVLGMFAFWVALVLLGVGWNFLFVGGTTLLTTACPEQDKAVGQGLSEFFVYSANAIASLTAGLLLHRIGWQVMNHVAVPFVVIVLVLCGALARRRRVGVAA